MKNKLTIVIILLLGVKVNLKAQQQIIKYPGYVSYWNPKTLIPDSVIWTITKEHLQSTKTPRDNKFHPEKGMQNLKRDYSGSHYDQGHNSPYDDNYWSAAAEYQCFSYVNMFPQRHILNAQTWEHLEVFCRNMALQYDSCRVKTSWRGIDKKIGQDSVVVPKICIKDIWYNGKHEHYEMPNQDTVVRHGYTYYLIK